MKKENKHLKTLSVQSFTGIKPRKPNKQDDSDSSQDEDAKNKTIPEKKGSSAVYIDVRKLPTANIDLAIFNDSLRHKMLR